MRHGGILRSVCAAIRGSVSGFPQASSSRCARHHRLWCKRPTTILWRFPPFPPRGCAERAIHSMDIEQTPVPMFDFLERAEEFLQAYKNLKRQGLFDWARYLLIGHAVEVALKAYLLPRGWRMEGLRK